MKHKQICSQTTLECDPRAWRVGVDTERWVNCIFKSNLESVEMLPLAFNVMEHQCASLIVQRHLNLQGLLLHFAQDYI